MQRVYDRLRPGCPVDEGGASLKSTVYGKHRARAVKSSGPPKSNIQVKPGPQSASLEGLPVELQGEVLQWVTDPASLEAIVHASPADHKTYMARRQYVFAKVLSRDTGQDVLLEAQAVVKALTVNQKDGSEIREFLQEYNVARQAKVSLLLERFPLPHLVILSQLHHAVKFAMKDFCQAALSENPPSSERLEDITPLSTNEARRISRAFYRFEIFCMIFCEPGLSVKPELDCADMCHLFLNQFPPWEVEEIACVRDYIVGRYTKLFRKHEHELGQCCPVSPPWAYQDSPGDERPFLGNTPGHGSCSRLS